MLDDLTLEIVRGECDESIHRYADMVPADIERCNCGSSLVRVVSETTDRGREFTAVCAKCGNHVFGLTDNYDDSNYKRIIYNHTRALSKSHCKNKPNVPQLDSLTKDKEGPESKHAYWIGYHEGVKYGYHAIMKFIDFINGKPMEEKE